MNKVIPEPMKNVDDPRIAAFGLLLEAHAGLSGVLGRELEEAAGLSLPWYEVLLRLGRSPARRMRMSELAASVALSASGLTRLVDRMEGAGHVRRERCPSDRRGAFAVLTDAGADALESATRVHLRGVERHLVGQLTDDELATLVTALDKLRRATRRQRPPGGRGPVAVGVG
jgi:MarR family transcriptional regulator, 2-MHQ and catechol-resistance regulon repressor